MNLYPKEEKRFTAQIWGAGAIPSYCTIFPVFHCLYCTTNRCSPSRTRALFSGQDSGIGQAAEIPSFSQKYNATDTAVILSKEEPPTPLRLRHRSQLLPACQHLPGFQHLPGCESFNKPLLPAGNTHTSTRTHTRAGKDSHNIRIIIIIVFIIRLIYIFILFFVDTKERLHNKRKCLFVWYCVVKFCLFCLIVVMFGVTLMAYL